MAFETTAEYYEILANAPKRIEREGPFLRECLAAAPGRRVVDVACGTGIHALFFAEEGADVTAMDISGEMVRHAERLRPHARIRYAVGDMRHIDGGTWDLAVCLGNSLSLIADEGELERVFASLGEHLEADGLFVTQTMNYAHPNFQEPRHRVERASHDGATVVAAKNLVPYGRFTLLSLAFHADDGSGIRSVAETAVLRNWTLDELKEAGERHGFRAEAVYGAFGRSAYDPQNSPDLIVVWRRSVCS